MSEDFLPFAQPTINQQAIEEVVACLQSGWLATGPRVKRLEEDLKTYLQAPQVVTFASATAGLHLTLSALHLQPGDEVITTPMTFVATLNTIVLAGGKPVLVDVDPRTYLIDIEQIAAAITPRTRAIIPVHFAGIPVDLDPLYALAEKHQLRIVEDAAQAIGTQYKNMRIGSFGDIQVFSFHPNKLMTTGEGGCVTTRDAALVSSLHTLRFHGIDREAFNRFSKEGSQHYDVVQPGYKYNMMDLQAALGVHQLAELENFIQHRTTLAQRYYELLADWPEWTLPGIPSYSHRHSWYIFAPLLNPQVAKMTRDEFMTKMKEQNIGIGLHYEAAHLYQYYRQRFGYRRGNFPIAEDIGSRIVSLPLFSHMTFDQQDRVIRTMSKLFGK
ncbi:MAG: DegT/DnrJ/EryC1/StrS family aminotransferase [Gammaproteobacteria bacterium]